VGCPDFFSGDSSVFDTGLSEEAFVLGTTSVIIDSSTTDVNISVTDKVLLSNYVEIGECGGPLFDHFGGGGGNCGDVPTFADMLEPTPGKDFLDCKAKGIPSRLLLMSDLGNGTGGQVIIMQTSEGKILTFKVSSNSTNTDGSGASLKIEANELKRYDDPASDGSIPVGTNPSQISISTTFSSVSAQCIEFDTGSGNNIPNSPVTTCNSGNTYDLKISDMTGAGHYALFANTDGNSDHRLMQVLPNKTSTAPHDIVMLKKNFTATNFSYDNVWGSGNNPPNAYSACLDFKVATVSHNSQYADVTSALTINLTDFAPATQGLTFYNATGCGGGTTGTATIPADKHISDKTYSFKQTGGSPGPHNFLISLVDAAASPLVPGAVQFSYAASLSYSSGTFSEDAVANNGSIDNSTPVTITLTGDTFTGSDNDDFTVGKIVLTNDPTGLTVVAKRTSTTTIDVTITGTASTHANSDDISNLRFAFQPSAFTTAPTASEINNSDKTDLVIDFID